MSPKPGEIGLTREFTPQGYGALIEELLGRGYVVRGFGDADVAKAHLILRHDVDVSLAYALPIAEVEAAIGTRASYFILLRSPLYNPFGPRDLTVIHRLCALGHEVGLHFDASLYANDWAQLDDAAERECAILEVMTGEPVTTISFHRPAKALLGDERSLGGRLHAYQPRFFSEMGYCSDSRGDWHHGHPLDHDAVANGQALQLLTHPVWWTGVPGVPVVERLGVFVEERAAEIREALAANIETYAPAAAHSDENP